MNATIIKYINSNTPKKQNKLTNENYSIKVIKQKKNLKKKIKLLLFFAT